MNSRASCVQAEGMAPAGGAEALTVEALHARYLRDVFRYVWQRVPAAEEAEDITAEVFAAAAAGLPRFRGQCPPYLWLLSIARRRIARARRQRQARRETLASELADAPAGADPTWEALAATEGPETTLIRAEARRVLRDLVADLKPDQREALMLQQLERLSVAQIAVVMGRSRFAVNSLLQRARASLFRRGRAYFLDTERNDETG